MQSLREIRGMLTEVGLVPRKRAGQCFLVDQNLLGKLLALAELTGRETVLEVGPGTGSLTEELLARAARVVAVEIDRRLVELLRRHMADRSGLVLIAGDVLAGKHKISRKVLKAAGPVAHMVSNLPYSIATPLIAECLLQSWRATAAGSPACRFDRLTFTVQREVADRLAARPGGGQYGPVSVLVSLLGRLKVGPAVPSSAFWPKPKVASRMLRIDFDKSAATGLHDARVLIDLLAMVFSQRRKQIGSIMRKSSGRFPVEGLLCGLSAAGVDPTHRPQQIAPEQFLTLANVLAGVP